jgi:hypothetical protein
MGDSQSRDTGKPGLFIATSSASGFVLSSELEAANGVGDASAILSPHNKLGTALDENYDATGWTKAYGFPYWAGAPKVMAVAPIPVKFDQALAVVSTMGRLTSGSTASLRIHSAH